MAENLSEQGQANSKQKKTPITFTALIWSGILIAAFGAIVAVFGVTGATVFEGKIGDIEVKTQSVGLAILVIGAVLAGFIATHLPGDVRILARKPRSLTEKIASRAIYFFIIGVVACILLIISFFVK
ncbi:MAG: hypothetical protein PVS3B1_32810 [Ktedonobacteraceae bacterium]